VSSLADGADPFAALGLPPRADLTDDDVRAAWRRIATATHPDRADGGDPGRFAVAAAAYTVLRTRSGRGEALADLASPSPAPGRSRPPTLWSRTPIPWLRRPDAPSRPEAPSRPDAAARPDGPSRTDAAARMGALPATWPGHPGVARLLSRIRRGRPARLALRVLIAAALSAVAVAVAGSQPATPALITGALTWLLLTARHDLAPPP
jgi:curved DNA-binding protein CbpA